MKIFDWYLIKRWFTLFVPTIIVLIFTYLSSDVAIKIWSLLERDIVPSSMILHFLLKLPTILFQMAPLASLLATLLTLTGLKRTGELGALFCSGISGIRIGTPLIIASMFVTGIIFYTSESLVPSANRLSRDIVRSGGAIGHHVVGKSRIWLLEGSHVIHIRNIEDNGQLLIEPTVLYFSGKGLSILRERIDAPQARWEVNHWVMDQAVVRRFENRAIESSEQPQRLIPPIEIRPEEFFRIRRRPEDMNRGELNRYIENLKRAGLHYHQYEVQAHDKTAFALLPLVFCVIALPVGFQVSIRGGAPLGIGLSILLALIFWSMYSLALSLGNSGILPAAFAAWCTGILFTVLGVAALLLKPSPRLT
jgi:lipopolysaccharide export system permease protein